MRNRLTVGFMVACLAFVTACSSGGGGGGTAGQSERAAQTEICPNVEELTLDLIKDWTYHDDTAFDAESVKANLDRHREAGSWNASALKDVTNVTVVDTDTVKIDTEHGAAALVAVLASSAGMMMSPAVFD